MSHWSHFISMSCTNRSMCYVSPLSPRATVLHHPVHLAIPAVLGPQWAVGATVWYMSRSSNFQKFCVHNENWGVLYINVIYNRAGVKYVFVFVFKYANFCICICIWKPTRWNICIGICIWLAYLGVFEKYFSNTLFFFTLKYIMMIIIINIISCIFHNP